MSDEKMKEAAEEAQRWLNRAEHLDPYLESAIRDLIKAALKQSPAADGWMPIEGRPIDRGLGHHLMFFSPVFGMQIHPATNQLHSSFTHFMPLPQPPKQHGEGGSR